MFLFVQLPCQLGGIKIHKLYTRNYESQYSVHSYEMQNIEKKKRTLEQVVETDSIAKKQLVTRDLGNISWELLVLVLPYIPRSNEVCKYWLKVREDNSKARLISAMRNQIQTGIGRILWSTPKSKRFHRGVGIGFHLLERDLCTLEDIAREVRKALHFQYPDEKLKYQDWAGINRFIRTTFTFLLEPGTLVSDTKDVSPWFFLNVLPTFKSHKLKFQIGNLVEFVHMMVDIAMPDAVIEHVCLRLPTHANVTNLDCLPFIMTCAGISQVTISRVSGGLFLPPTFGGAIPTSVKETMVFRANLANLYPAYILDAGEKYSHFIDHIANHATISDNSFETAQWLFSQGLSSHTESSLIESLCKFAPEFDDLETDKTANFDKFIGTAFEHIHISESTAFDQIVKGPVPSARPAIRFLCRRAKKRGDFTLQMKVFEHCSAMVDRYGSVRNAGLLVQELLNSTSKPVDMVERFLLESNNRISLILSLFFEQFRALDWNKLKGVLLHVEDVERWMECIDEAASTRPST